MNEKIIDLLKSKILNSLSEHIYLSESTALGTQNTLNNSINSKKKFPYTPN